jgi:hypothetical protein
MISFLTILGPDGRRLVQQKLTHPGVYLDTWAIRLFAEIDPALGERFRAALQRAGGTLVISHLSVGEFAKFDDPRHTRCAGRYIDTVIPNLFLSTFEPFRVIEREIPVMVRQTAESPAGDSEMLRLYAEAAEQRGWPSVYEWFAYMYTDRASIAARTVAMAQSFLDGVTALRKRFDTEPGFAKSAMRDIKNSTRPRATQALLRALLYRLHRNRRLELTINDAIDIGHCIVPAAYCDFVLADLRWHTQLNDATTLLRRSGIETRVALIYTKRDNGVIKFLEKLEAWPVKQSAA